MVSGTQKAFFFALVIQTDFPLRWNMKVDYGRIEQNILLNYDMPGHIEH